MNLITVNLPRESLGQQILDAFRNASTFQENPTQKWCAISYEAETGVAEVDASFIADKGIYATPAYLRSQNQFSRRLFGNKPDKWVTREGLAARFLTQIRLHEISPSRLFQIVKVSVHHEFDPDLGGGFKVANSPDEEKFSPFRPAYDRIIREFLLKLS